MDLVAIFLLAGIALTIGGAFLMGGWGAIPFLLGLGILWFASDAKI